MPEVISIIPVYNGERFLPATLASLAAQTRRPDRIVVVDDGSTDDTCGVVERFQAGNPGLAVELHRNPKNLGLFENLNRCLDWADQCDLLHILLADDLVKPAFLERLVPLLEPCPAPSLAYTLCDAIDPSGAFLKPIGPGSQAAVREVPRREFLRRQCELQTIYCGSLVLKSGRQPSPCRFPVDFRHVGDCLFYARLGEAAHTRVEVGDRLCQIRLHGGSASAANARRLQSWVLDEWRVMQELADGCAVPGLGRWCYRVKLRCLFAARSVVKVQLTRAATPEFATEIATATKARVGHAAWIAGRIAVWLRDRLFGSPHA